MFGGGGEPQEFGVFPVHPYHQVSQQQMFLPQPQQWMVPDPAGFPNPVQGYDHPSAILPSDLKQRLRWSPRLHNKFVDAVNLLGGHESEDLTTSLLLFSLLPILHLCAFFGLGNGMEFYYFFVFVFLSYLVQFILVCVYDMGFCFSRPTSVSF